ncbi:hypothetical protein NEA10_11885 [Phormidium yuhuli AB48]|uniref:Uncharacterized protein n=1 Tax=Phormidium yuhuli AB48 TaxID=2940671 RepID=A0ABY5AKF0_9CYAN|nr:hypothetical protein [Phormidium yuhuli]USR89582.1 hypothetical protein NEA10_11885 [Phormidium yuhuli AB48]
MAKTSITGQAIFILKVVVASLLGTLAIKYIAPIFAIPVNGLSALTIIFTPVLVLIGVFLTRGR